MLKYQGACLWSVSGLELDIKKLCYTGPMELPYDYTSPLSVSQAEPDVHEWAANLLGSCPPSLAQARLDETFQSLVSDNHTFQRVLRNDHGTLSFYLTLSVDRTKVV